MTCTPNLEADEDEIANEIDVFRQTSRESSGYDSADSNHDAECADIACADIDAIDGKIIAEQTDMVQHEEKTNETQTQPRVVADDCDSIHSAPSVSYEQLCDRLLEPYYWQRPIPNEERYGAFYSQFKKEILNNPCYRFSVVNFSNLLKKVQAMRSQWFCQKIRSPRCGTQGSHKWRAGESISEIELFAVKMYTDFEECQFELKKCYRAPINANELEYLEYEKRLSYFAQWRKLLGRTIFKYGTLLNRRVFYQGIDKIMKLNMDPTHRCIGPVSSTSDLSVARGFATKNGFILTMCSRYPRLHTDYYFDASTISAFPDEKEMLIGFAHTRVLHVELGRIQLTVTQLCRDQLLKELTCFIISSLLRNHLYSYGSNLELLFKALLVTDNEYNNQEEMDRFFQHIQDKERAQEELQKMIEISTLIPRVIVDEFQRFRKEQKVLKLDTISDGMKCVFCGPSGQICVQRVCKYSPHIEELHLSEEYLIDDKFVSDFLRFTATEQTKLHTIKFMKFCFDGNSDQFQFEDTICADNRNKLKDLGWRISEKHKTNSYILKLCNQRKKNNRVI